MIPHPADHSVIHMRLIGPMQAWTTAGEEVSPPGLRTRALLAVIALSAPRPVQRVWCQRKAIMSPRSAMLKCPHGRLKAAVRGVGNARSRDRGRVWCERALSTP
jgi:hypothetical protein